MKTIKPNNKLWSHEAMILRLGRQKQEDPGFTGQPIYLKVSISSRFSERSSLKKQ